MKYLELLHSPILTPQIAALTQRAAYNNIPVLIQGEQGTGKELIAKLIHHLGDWRGPAHVLLDHPPLRHLLDSLVHAAAHRAGGPRAIGDGPPAPRDVRDGLEV